VPRLAPAVREAAEEAGDRRHRRVDAPLGLVSCPSVTVVSRTFDSRRKFFRDYLRA
jgi:hypothetical protein